MKSQKNNNLIQLKNWLLNKPVFFALSFFGLNLIIGLVYAAIQTFFNFHTLTSLYILFAASFVFCTWYTIKKLPHESLNQNDFVAITNGASIISLSASVFVLLFIGISGLGTGTKLMMLYLTKPVILGILFLLLTLLALYLAGLAICGIYAKYKRATTIGISKWRVILSMPFGFLLTWTPGYLIQAQNTKTTLEIKCKWYTKFNKWVMANLSNTLFVFLFFLLFKGIIAGLPTLILYSSLLLIYGLWYAKHKSDFIKNINNGYALTAIGINFAILLAFLVRI